MWEAKGPPKFDTILRGCHSVFPKNPRGTPGIHPLLIHLEASKYQMLQHMPPYSCVVLQWMGMNMHEWATSRYIQYNMVPLEANSNWRVLLFFIWYSRKPTKSIDFQKILLRCLSRWYPLSSIHFELCYLSDLGTPSPTSCILVQKWMKYK